MLIRRVEEDLFFANFDLFSPVRNAIWCPSHASSFLPREAFIDELRSFVNRSKVEIGTTYLDFGAMSRASLHDAIPLLRFIYYGVLHVEVGCPK